MKWYTWCAFILLCVVMIAFIGIQVRAGIHFWNVPAAEVPWWIWWIRLSK